MGVPGLHLQNKAPEQPMKAAIPQQADVLGWKAPVPSKMSL